MTAILDSVKPSQTDNSHECVAKLHQKDEAYGGDMDRLGLWSIPYMIIVLTVGEFSRQVFAPGLQALQPGWPLWIVNLAASLPGFVPMWIIGYWLFRRFDPSRRSRP